VIDKETQTNLSTYEKLPEIKGILNFYVIRCNRFTP